MRYSVQLSLALLVVAVAASAAWADAASRTAGSKIEGNYTGSRPRMVYRTYRAAPQYVVTTQSAPAQATAAAPAAPVAKPAPAPAQTPAPAVAQTQRNGATRSFSYQGDAGTPTTAPARTYYQYGRRARGARYLDASRKPLGDY